MMIEKIDYKNRKFILLMAVIIFTAMFLCILFSGMKEGKAERKIPIITDSPLYAEIPSENTMEIKLHMSDDIEMSEVLFLMVNVDKSGIGSIRFDLLDANNNVLSSETINESSIKAGDWNSVRLSAELIKDEDYSLEITPLNCDPFLMYVPEIGMSTLPFSEKVYLSEDELPLNVSVGISIPLNIPKISLVHIALLCILTVIFCICLLALYKTDYLRKVFVFADKYKNIIFLIAVLVFICTDVYSKAFKNGVQISADSSGYLREAVNLKASNGYSYDGLAGYKSWFANWPILYPFFIFLVMLISGLDAYISSKILTIILCFFILLTLKRRYKNEAYLYTVVLLNLGFLTLCQYTWSEIPFILFMLLFTFKLGDIVEDFKDTSLMDYLLLGLYGFLTFLTRYFGIFVWVVVGIYILVYFVDFLRKKDKQKLFSAVKLSATAMISGILSIGYLFLNKIMNGMPSGVSRSDWWDDYHQLTRDLIDSLFTEVFNAFHLNVQGFIKALNYPMKTVFLIVLILIAAVYLVRKMHILTKTTVFFVMSATYYAMFIVIRYFSSMDTFYFRFFEPASFLLSIGILDIALAFIKKKGGIHVINGIYASIFALIMLSIVINLSEGLSLTKYDYYSVVKSEWDNQYKEVPHKSVVIFSDLDYRSEYYRPDVIGGEISTSDSLEDLKERYYGSEYLVIQKEYAEVMLESNAYSESVNKMLSDGLLANEYAQKYISVSLQN